MTQALAASLGGSPFGPAGTGKTETVKALGNQLGRFVLVFNCDETFDFQVSCCFTFKQNLATPWPLLQGLLKVKLNRSDPIQKIALYELMTI